MVLLMYKETNPTILTTVDNLAAYSSKLHGLADCLDALSYRYDPGDDLALLAETLEDIACGLTEATNALEDATAGETRPKTRKYKHIKRLHPAE